MAEARPNPDRTDDLRAALAQARALVAALLVLVGDDEGAPAIAPTVGAVKVEPADLTVRDIASALGVSARTVERLNKDGRFVGDAAPIVIGGLDRRRYRWRSSQLPAIRAVFAAPPVAEVVAVAAASKRTSKGRPPGRKAKGVAEAERKDVLLRFRDGD